MGFYIFDSHEVGATGKLEMVQQIPGATEVSQHLLPTVVAANKQGFYPVCWVDNEIFEAVAIAYDDDELKRFLHGMAGRAHLWFLVPTEELIKMRPMLAEYLRGQRGWRE